MFRKFSVVLIALVVLMAVSGAANAWKFAAIADTQGNDNGVNTAVLTKIINCINAEKVDFVIVCGDATSGSPNEATASSMMDTWVTTMKQLNCPYYYSPGNHCIQTPTAQENVLRTKVVQPENGPAGDLEMVYSFDHQNAHFVSLNTDRYNQTNQVQTLQWFAGNLANVTQPHIFVFAHKPAYVPVLNTGLDDRNELWNILTTSCADTYFCGHVHTYQRSLHGGVYQIINGGAGGNLVPEVPGTFSKHHYVVISVDGNNVHGEAKDDTCVAFDKFDYAITPPIEATCASAKDIADGTKVILRNKTVTRISENTIYVEDPDQAASLKAVVSYATGLAVGDKVNVSGALVINASGEREIQGAAMKLPSVTTTNRSSCLPGSQGRCCPAPARRAP